MRNTLWKACLVALSASAMWGCSSSSDKGTDTKTATAALDACTAMYTSFGAFAQHCGYAVSDGMVADAAKKACPEVQKAVKAGRMAFDETKLDACKTMFSGMACDADFDFDQLPGACGEMLHGKVAENAACYFDGECAAGYCNEGNLCPGACKPFVKVGGSCGPDDTCESGSVCDQGQCAALGTGASTCQSDADCASGYFCNGMNKCQERQAMGAACNYPEECKSGLTCRLASGQMAGTCQPPLAEGDVCRNMYDCGASLRCLNVTGIDTDPLKCAQPRKLDEDCEFGRQECAAPMYCGHSTGRCTAASEEGGPCGLVGGADGYEIMACNSGNCDIAMGDTSGRCLAYKVPGESCTSNTQCEYGCGTNHRCNPDQSCTAP